MTPAEKRVKELIDRWLTSLDLHLQYVDLNDSAYNKVQPWPVHDRPTRWVLEHAKQKALELKAAFESRLGMGDAKFAESVELIAFLANLVGIQHVQRFVPLADPERHGQATLTELDGLKPVPAATGNTTIAMPPRAPSPPPLAKPVPPTAPEPQAMPARQAVAEDDATREMPRPQRLATTPPPSPPAPKPAVAAKPAENSQKGASRTGAGQTQQPSKAASPAKGGALTEIQKTIIDDAVRMLNWGRPWHELAELIARMADRPKVAEVRRILRSHRAAIEMRAASSEEEAEKEK